MEWINVPNDLTTLRPQALWDLKDDLRAYRSRWGRGRTEAAYQVKAFVRESLASVSAELRRRKLPQKAPTDGRIYGPAGIG